VRFEPERSFGENANKDRAIYLLQPIKDKYGRGLSWGDLIILTANTAYEELGAPVLGYCAGRIDQIDTYHPTILTDRGQIPLTDQPGVLPLLDPTFLGNICTDAEGINGTANPVNTSSDVRITFTVKGFNDEETVALVGGGMPSERHMAPVSMAAVTLPTSTPPTPGRGSAALALGRTSTTPGSRARGPRTRPAGTTSTSET